MGVLYMESPILENFAPPEAQNVTNRRAAANIADRRQSPPLTASAQSVEELVSIGNICRRAPIHRMLRF